jgi:hypothetical protein
MFVVKKDNTKSFRHARLIENITEDNLDEIFEDGNEVFSMSKLTKEEALAVQKQKDIQDLYAKQQEIQAQLAKLSGQGTPDQPAPVVAPQVHFLSEEEKNKADPNFTPATPTPPVVAKSENIPVPNKPFTVKKDTYPTNPETKKPYTKQEYMKTYQEFKDMAEKREEVASVLVTPHGFKVELVEDIKLAPTHRGIPLRKDFV